MQILLQDSIRPSELKLAAKLLNLFVKEVEVLNRCNDFRYNSHQLIHLALIVARWSPLWASSAFIFEDNNGFLSNVVHGTQSLSTELTNNLKLIYAIKSFEKKLYKIELMKLL